MEDENERGVNNLQGGCHPVKDEEHRWHCLWKPSPSSSSLVINHSDVWKSHFYGEFAIAASGNVLAWSSSIVEASSKIWKSEKWKFVYKENMRHCHSLDPQPSTISWSCSWLNLKLWTACHGHQNSTCFTNSLMIISSCGISTNFACVWQHPANGHWGNSKGCDGISSDVWEVLLGTALATFKSEQLLFLLQTLLNTHTNTYKCTHKQAHKQTLT